MKAELQQTKHDLISLDAEDISFITLSNFQETTNVGHRRAAVGVSGLLRVKSTSRTSVTLCMRLNRRVLTFSANGPL